MNTDNLLKLAEFLEYYEGEFDLNDWKLMKSILGKCGFEKEDNENWSTFFQRMFDLFWVLNEWGWCFYSNWMEFDPSAIGCAARIRILVNEGCPKNWHEQVWGEEPLSYNLEDLKLIKEIEKVLR